MVDYKNSDRFIRTSKEVDPSIHKPEHIRRWSWIGKEGKTFFDAVYGSQKKRIFNALKNSSSDSVIKFKQVLKKIIDGK